jgi:hypothetical protein
MAKGRVYTVVFGAVSISAAQDAFELSPTDDKPIELVGLMFNQTGNSDVGDAAEEFIRWTVLRGHTTGGSGGSAPTPRPVKRSDPAAGFAAEVNNTTVASAGTAVTLHEDSFNVRAGGIFWWPEGCEPDAAQGDGTLVVRLAAPADAITVSGTAYVRELG